MGQRCSRYLGSSDALHIESDTVRASQMETEKCDTTCDSNTFMKNDVASQMQDGHSNACLVSTMSVDTVYSANSTSSSTPTTVTVTSSQRNAEHQPWFFTHMTEEHWERLNMMCIVSPSSS